MSAAIRRAVEIGRVLTAAPAGQPTRLEFLRNRRRRVLEATPATAFELAALAAR
jgi:hypothetical protein